MSQSSIEISGDQLAPHSIEAEEAVLGSVLLNPDALYEIPFLKPDEFFLVRHGWIFEAMLTIAERRDPVDHLTVVTELEGRGRLAEVGGASYIISLINKSPSALNVEGYGHIVERLAIRRRLVGAAQLIAREAHSDETDIDTTIANSHAHLNAVTAGRVSDVSIATAADIASMQFDRVQAVARGDTVAANKLPTGLIDLDALIGGLRNDDLIIIAARPGMGKSSMVNQIVVENAKAGAVVGLVNFEMSSLQATTRILSAESGVPFQAIQDEAMNDAQLSAYGAAFAGATEWLPRIPLEDRITMATPEALRLIAIRMQAEFGIQALFVDYLQKMRVPKLRDNRVQEVSYIARELKSLAKELHIPVIAPSQLSRQLEQRTDKRPILSDLRESGEIEQEADVVAFLYRDAYYNPDSPDGMKAEINIAKHRNGPTGMVNVIWNGPRFRFENAASVQVDLNEPKRQTAPTKNRKSTTTAPFVPGRDDPADRAQWDDVLPPEAAK